MSTDSNYAVIPLSQGYYTLVDSGSPALQYKWRARVIRGIYVYAVRDEKIGEKFKQVYLHRFLTPCPEGMCVDHINRNTLDNRSGNLRVATYAQNAANCQGERRLAKSGYHGVHYTKTKDGRDRWSVIIRWDGASKRFGVFDSAMEAALVADQVATKRWGAQARLNFK